MKVEIRRETIEVGVMVTLWTASTSAHALATEERAALEAAVGKFADWMTAEFQRLRAARRARPHGAMAHEPAGDERGLQAPPDDPLADFRAETDPAPLSIVVNGKAIEVVSPGRYLSYRELVALAGMAGQPTVVFSYPDGRGATLPPTHYVTLVPGIVINVAHTGNA